MSEQRPRMALNDDAIAVGRCLCNTAEQPHHLIALDVLGRTDSVAVGRVKDALELLRHSPYEAIMHFDNERRGPKGQERGWKTQWHMSDDGYRRFQEDYPELET